MSGNLKPYPKYKDFGLPWLGRVPAHWGVRRAKYLAREIDLRSADESGTLLSVSQYTGVTKRRSRQGSDDPDTRASSLIGYKVAGVGDLVVNIMLAWNGSLGVAPVQGVVSPAYCVYRFREGDPWFFHHLLRAPEYKAEIKRSSRGVVDSRLRLYTDDFFRIPLLLPNEAEQKAIVRYVRELDKKVNRFIRNRRRLIGVLNEQKQAIINQAVTRGLDPDTPLKPSGIDWLGDVPTNWDVLQIRRVSTHITSGPRDWSSLLSDEGDLFLQSGNLGRSLNLKLDKVNRLKPPGGAETARTRVMLNDVLICVTGALTGNVVHVSADPPAAYINQHVALVRLRRDKVHPRFIAYFLHSRYGQIQFKNAEYGGTKQGLGLGDIASVITLLPSRDTQESIAKELDVAVNDTTNVIQVAEREIDLIREYRTRLIADVVTGNVDVRGLVPPETTELLQADDELDEALDGEDDPGMLEDDEPELVEEAEV